MTEPTPTAENDAAIRSVQYWMASDLQSALGYEPNIDPDPSFGEVGWADWWAQLCHEVRVLSGDEGLPDCEGWTCQSCGADNFIPAGWARVIPPGSTVPPRGEKP